MDGESPVFRMDDLAPEARKRKLDPKQGMALAKALELAWKSPMRPVRTEDQEDAVRNFLLPFAEFGMDSAQMLGLLDKVPAEWPLSHRDMYYDFRLGRWQRHIEPPTLADCLVEYLENAPSRAEGLAYIRKEWDGFLKKHAKA